MRHDLKMNFRLPRPVTQRLFERPVERASLRLEAVLIIPLQSALSQSKRHHVGNLRNTYRGQHDHPQDQNYNSQIAQLPKYIFRGASQQIQQKVYHEADYIAEPASPGKTQEDTGGRN